MPVALIKHQLILDYKEKYQENSWKIEYKALKATAYAVSRQGNPGTHYC
jgi:hypothetical protein